MPQSDTFAIDYNVFDAGYNPIPPSSGGGINPGGQPGPITIGTTDNTDFTLIAGSAINIGDANTENSINLNGSITFQYDEITGVSSYYLTETNYFINVTDPMTNGVYLPLANIAPGRQYIINKGYDEGTLTIRATGSDKIDTSAITFPLFGVLNAKVTLIADGENNWLIV
jgi:hypothetical protein